MIANPTAPLMRVWRHDGVRRCDESRIILSTCVLVRGEGAHGLASHFAPTFFPCKRMFTSSLNKSATPMEPFLLSSPPSLNPLQGSVTACQEESIPFFTMSSAKQSFDAAEDGIATIPKAYTSASPATPPNESAEASKTASREDVKSSPSPFEIPVGHAGVGAVSRKLSSRHIQMIGIGGGIGTGLFVGSGIALTNAGPVGVLLAYIITGMMIFGVMEGLAEMSSYLPVSGSFMHFASRFVDPSLGMALGWNYWWCYAIGWASELSAASAVIGYWNADINIAAWISIMMVVGAVLNFAGVNIYGESEVITSTIKLLAFVAIIIFGLVIDLGGGPRGDRLGFRYWKEPGAFNQYNGIGGAEGRFLGFFSALIQVSE